MCPFYRLQSEVIIYTAREIYNDLGLENSRKTTRLRTLY